MIEYGRDREALTAQGAVEIILRQMRGESGELKESVVKFERLLGMGKVKIVEMEKERFNDKDRLVSYATLGFGQGMKSISIELPKGFLESFNAGGVRRGSIKPPLEAQIRALVPMIAGKFEEN